MMFSKKKFYNSINHLLNKIDIQLSKRSFFEKLLRNQSNDLKLLKKIDSQQRSKYIDYIDLSKSQIRQDLFVLSELRFKQNGYFVDC